MISTVPYFFLIISGSLNPVCDDLLFCLFFCIALFPFLKIKINIYNKINKINFAMISPLFRGFRGYRKFNRFSFYLNISYNNIKQLQKQSSGMQDKWRIGFVINHSPLQLFDPFPNDLAKIDILFSFGINELGCHEIFIIRQKIFSSHIIHNNTLIFFCKLICFDHALINKV